MTQALEDGVVYSSYSDPRKISCNSDSCLGAKNEGHVDGFFFVESAMVAFPGLLLHYVMMLSTLEFLYQPGLVSVKICGFSVV